MKREESLEKIVELSQSQDFDPLWNFIIPSIEKIIDRYYENSEVKCSIEITNDEKIKYNLDLLLCLNVIREILNSINIKCNLISLKGNNLKVFFNREAPN